MNKLTFLIFATTLFSCVSKTEYDKLNTEKELLTQKLNLLQIEYDKLLEAQRQEEIQRTKIKYYSEQEALGYIKDYYSFYQPDILYRNVRLRRTGDNSFKVSLETTTSKGDFSNDDFFWSSQVYNLTISNDGKYKLTAGYW